MKNIKWYLLLFLGLALLSFINGSPFIFGDGYGYFHSAKTLVTKGYYPVDNFVPEYYPYTGHAVFIDTDGKSLTSYPPGNAILWWPFLTVAKVFDSGTVYNDYYKAFNGHSFADGVAILTATTIYAFLSLILIYKILTNLKFTNRNALISTGLIFLSSFALGYIHLFPSYSHTNEIFALSALLFFLIKFGQRFEYKYMFSSGIFAGLLVLIRPVDIVIVLSITLFIFLYRNLKSKVYYLLGATPFAIILFAYNYFSYGGILKFGYSADSTMGFDLTRFNLGNLLFSDIRGWFIYSPLMVLALVGLVLYSIRALPSILLYLLPTIFLILAYSFWPNWWGGDSLSQRFFLVLIPFMAIGLAHLNRSIYQKFRINYDNYISGDKNKYLIFIQNSLGKVLIIFAIILTGYSLTIYLLYRITPVNSLYQFNENSAKLYPEVQPEGERFGVSDIVNYHLENTISSESLRKDFNGGRSLMLLALGQTQPLAKIQKTSENTFSLHVIPDNIFSEKILNIDINIFYNNKKYSFLLNNINAKQHSEIKFICEEDCETDWIYVNEISDLVQEGDKLININDKISISMKSNDEVNFIDYKLKNL